MQKTLFAEFLKVEASYKDICAKRDAVRAEIVEEMQKSKVEKAETEYGIFTIAKRAVWAYTEAVRKLEQRVKLAKVREEKKGLATRTETEYLRFTGLEKEI